VPILIGNAIDYIVGPGNVNFEVVAKILVQIAFAVGITAIFEWFMYTINNNYYLPGGAGYS